MAEIKIKAGQTWVTGTWRTDMRRVTITRVSGDEIHFTFDDGQESVCSDAAFRRIYDVEVAP